MFSYNELPDDSRQPEILETHIRELAALFIRNRAHEAFGIHLAHAHFAIPESTILLGNNYNTPYCRWAKITDSQLANLSNMHGHIFVLTEHGFHPYEFQNGPAPDLSQVHGTFLSDLADYLTSRDLSLHIGLQVLDQHCGQMLELVLPGGTIMLDVSDLEGCIPTRQTGWKFEIENGKPRVCKPNETHGRHANGHDVYNEGAPHPRLQTFQDVKIALAEKKILRQELRSLAVWHHDNVSPSFNRKLRL